MMLGMHYTRATLLVAAFFNIQAKNPIIDKDYVHDINLDANKRFEKTDAFKIFIQKYDPVDIFDKIDKMEKKRGRNFTTREEVDLVLQGIDPTNDLLRLKVQNGNPKVLALSSSRRQFKETWTPPPGLSIYPKDRFGYKPRLYELMKQAIYQARNKMVLMQLKREKYRTRPMYKMGYLLSKTDNACKVFNKVAFHAYRTCHRLLNNHRLDSRRYFRFRIYELQVSHMRVLHLWFSAELLTDLVIRNDVAFHEAFESHGLWNFTN